MNARCVILDIGGVLEITPRTGWAGAWEQRLGLPPGAVRDRLDDVWQAGMLGEVSEREVREQVASRLRLDANQLEALMGDLWAEYLGAANDELTTYVRGLHNRCKLGILSNSFVGARERETALYGLDELVEQLVYSHEIGISKPDLRAYELTLGRLDARPADCLFIDDLPTNIEAAREVGMRAHLFDGNAATIARIAHHLALPTTRP